MKKSQLKQLIRKVITEVMQSNNDINKNDSHKPEENRFEWENDPYHSRRFEKSDVSWREYDMDMNPQSYRFKEGEEEKLYLKGDGNAYDEEEYLTRHLAARPHSRYSNKQNMAGITFFEVPAGKEEEAKRLGLIQFKSGKFGIKHKIGRDYTGAVSAAEKIFGKGRYWEPRK
jgi:hypothetical protein